MRKIFCFTIFAVLLLTACQTAGSIDNFSAIKQTMISNTWLLQDDSGTVVSYNNKEVSMKFEAPNIERVNGFAGCNNYFSQVELLPGSIKFTGTGSTMMACPDMDGEDAFLSLLNQVDNYELTANELKLYNGKVLLLKFKAK